MILVLVLVRTLRAIVERMLGLGSMMHPTHGGMVVLVGVLLAMLVVLHLGWRVTLVLQPMLVLVMAFDTHATVT